jgi:hypothetical protein
MFDQLAGERELLLRLSYTCLVALPLLDVAGQAQYKGDHIPGFLGLESGAQAPPGIYVGDLLWVYPTNTVKDNNGDQVNQRGSLISTLDGALISFVSNYRVLGANYGATIVIPFI